MKKCGLLKDEKGMFEMPSQYVVAIFVAGISISIMGFAIQHLSHHMQLEEAIKEVNKIVREAELMYNTGDNCSMNTVVVDFPPGMEKAVFGSSNADNTNRYYVLMNWGENRSFYSQYARFIGENNGRAVLYGEIKSVTLELVSYNGDKYVSIRSS